LLADVDAVRHLLSQQQQQPQLFHYPMNNTLYLDSGPIAHVPGPDNQENPGVFVVERDPESRSIVSVKKFYDDQDVPVRASWMWASTYTYL
jgi:hypothetical protein